MDTFIIVIVAAALLMLIAKIGLRIDRSGAREKIRQGATVVDVRTPAEFESGHYAGARNIPLGELKGRTGELGDKQAPVVVYCASGARSGHAARILKAAGFTDVTNAGGLRGLQV